MRQTNERGARSTARPCGPALLLLALLCFAPPVAADPTISIEPPIVTMGLDDYRAVQVWADNSGDPISCFMVQIHFDSLVVEVTDVVEGLLFTGAGLPTYPVEDLIAPDTLQVGNCVLGSGTFIMGPGALVDIVFHSLNEGFSPIELAFVQVRDIDRLPYGNPGVEHGSIVVGTVGVGDSGTPAASAAPRLRISPNPAPGWARIELLGAAAMPIALPGTLDIYDIGGRLQRTLTAPGAAQATLDWDGRDAIGRPLPAGVYFVRPRMSGVEGVKVLLVR